MLKARLKLGRFTLLGLLLILVLQGCSDDAPEASTEPETADVTTLQVEATPAAAKKVRSLQMVEQDITIYKSYVGYTKSYKTVTISSEIEGRVDSVGVSQGKVIKKGQIIAGIAQKDMTLSKDLALTNYNLSKSELERLTSLKNNNVISDADYDRALATKETNYIRYEQASSMLDKATPKSPLSGLVNNRYFELGEYVRKGDRLVDVLILDPLLVELKIPESDILFFYDGEAVAIDVSAVSEQVYQGKVSYISRKSDANKTFLVEATFSNPKSRLPDGLLANVSVATKSIKDALFIPRHVIVVLEDGSSGVFVVNDGLAQLMPVELGESHGDLVEVTEGLSPGQDIVVEGYNTLTDGMKIDIVP